MKIVLDTNVLLSALATQGISYRILDICLDKHQLYISQWIINETTEKLLSKFSLTKSEIEKFKVFVKEEFNFIAPKGQMPDICRDHDDNNVLHLAQFVNADIVITGDKDLLVIESFNGIKIINPRTFIENYK